MATSRREHRAAGFARSARPLKPTVLQEFLLAHREALLAEMATVG